jgi:hypothetical protein
MQGRIASERPPGHLADVTAEFWLTARTNRRQLRRRNLASAFISDCFSKLTTDHRVT